MAEQKLDSPSFRMIYFPIQGRCGALRLAAFIGGISYEDEFVTGEELKQSQVNGKRRWRGIPEITIFNANGAEVTSIGQSNACLRYIGKLSGLYPNTQIERRFVDEILDSIEDTINLISPSIHEKDEEKKKAMRLELMEPMKLPYWLKKFELRLEERKSTYFVGNKLSIADLKFYFVGTWLMSNILDHIDGEKLMAPCKRLKALIHELKENQDIKKFEAEFALQQKQYKEKKTKCFKHSGKGVYAA